MERVYDSVGRIIHEEITLNGETIQKTQQSWTPSGRTLEIGDHKREFHYQAGRIKRLAVKDFELSYDYAMNGLLAKKASPFSTVEINYNTSGLPKTIHTQFAGDIYEEALQWTNAGKLSMQETTYPSSNRKIYTYSSRGHLKSVNDQEYTFDFDLAGRGIRTSSPNSEIPNNGLDIFGKVLSEIIDNEMIDINYDNMGQVITHGNNRLSWDPWGRLITVTNETYNWTASYDALGRRLQTSYTPIFKGKFWDSKGKSLITTSFYDPEDKFQEIGINYDGRTFWKLCNNTCCDAILDEEGNAVTLVHDIQENLSAIISLQDIVWNEYKPSPYGSLSIPSLKPELFSVAQAHIWKSKCVDQTGLIWLGARYYNPIGGRFFSPDSVSYPACLDLYAYANGDPINNADLNGLFSSPVYGTVLATNINSRSSLPIVTCDETFETRYSPNNRSRKYDLSDLGRPEMPFGLRVGFINGIKNEFGFAKNSAIYISDLIGGYNIHCVYSATINFRKDVEAYNRALKCEDTGRMHLLHEIWNEHFDKYPDGYFLQYSHSRGSVDARNAALMYPEHRRNRIVHIAIAPGGYIYSETCASVKHYRVPFMDDFIPYNDSAGEKREEHTTITLKSHKDAPFHDHTILSPTYRNSIREAGEFFIQTKGKGR